MKRLDIDKRLIGRVYSRLRRSSRPFVAMPTVFDAKVGFGGSATGIQSRSGSYSYLRADVRKAAIVVLPNVLTED
jgi:hypothetical protein